MTYQGYVSGRNRYGNNAGYTRPAPQNIQRTAASAEEQYRRARGAEMRRREAAEAARRRREAELHRRHEAELRRIKAYEARIKRERKAAKAAEAAERKRARKAEEAAILRREIKVEKKKMPVSFVIIVLTAFVLLMGVVFSYAQIAQSGAELSEIKGKLSDIKKESAELEVSLEHKNDVTVIEERAVGELMMVREDAVQKKYVTTSTGDRIVLDSIGDENGETSSFFGSVLSSFSSAFDDILDYFR